MKIVAYLHVYCVGPWLEIVNEICTHLAASGLDVALGKELRVGVVGPLHHQATVINLITDYLKPEVVAAGQEGWEQLTLTQMWRDAHTEDWDACLYLHSKGVTAPSAWNDAWRDSMLRAMVDHWQACLQLLASAQVVTTHWLAPEMDLPHPVISAYPAGNMFWSRREHIVALPEPSMKNRFEAEAWIGRVRPTVADLCSPGWPSPETLFRAHRR